MSFKYPIPSKNYFFILLFLVFLFPISVQAGTYYVATTGSNSNNGSESSPWASISYAVSQLASGSDHTIIVKDGTYEGNTSINRSFAPNWVTIRAENPYHVKLTNVSNGYEVFTINYQGSVNVIVEGFYFTNWVDGGSCSRRNNVMVHFENASHIIFRNNILYGNNAPSTCNELLKINRGYDHIYVREIYIQGNLFYDHPSISGADQIDSVRPGELDVSDNIFFAEHSNNAQSFITIKREAPASLVANPREHRFKVYRNVFLNWNGRNDQAFIQFGEDAPDTPQIDTALVENNLFVGNSSDTLGGAMQFKDSHNIEVRANTVVGDLPGGSFGFRIGTEISGSSVEGISIRNNLYYDPTGTMTRLMGTYGNVLLNTFTLDNNLFYNEGNPLPVGTSGLNPTDDINRIETDPLMNKDHSFIQLPRWSEANQNFPSSNTTIRQEFERLVFAYGSIADSSPAIDHADSNNMPDVDILNRTRDDNKDVGAYEFNAGPTPSPTPTPTPTPSPTPTSTPTSTPTATATPTTTPDPKSEDNGSTPTPTPSSYNPYGDAYEAKDQDALYTAFGGCGLTSQESIFHSFPFLTLFLLFVILLTLLFTVRRVH